MKKRINEIVKKDNMYRSIYTVILPNWWGKNKNIIYCASWDCKYRITL